MDGIAVNGPHLWQFWLKPSQWSKFLFKIFEKYFLMNSFIGRRGYIEVILCIRLLTPYNLQDKKQGFSQFYPLALYCGKWQKMVKFMRAGKQEGVVPLAPNFFLLILMILNPCHLNFVMISLVVQKCQGKTTRDELGK